MNKLILFTAFLALSVSAKAGAMRDLDILSSDLGVKAGDVMVPQVPGPVEVKSATPDIGAIFGGIIGMMGETRGIYKVGPFDRRRAQKALYEARFNLENAGARVARAYVEGGWYNAYAVVEYRAKFKIKQYRRDRILNAHRAYDKMDRIIADLHRKGVDVIFGRVEGVPGDFSIIIDYADNASGEAAGAEIIGGIIGLIIDAASHPAAPAPAP